MPFCTNCGAAVDGNDSFCTSCGQPLKNRSAKPATPAQPAVVSEQAVYEMPQGNAQYMASPSYEPQGNAQACSTQGFESQAYAAQQMSAQSQGKGSIGWWILGFLFPLVGLILFLIWRKERPGDAKRAGWGALIGVVLETFLVIVSLLFFSVFASSLLQQEGTNAVVGLIEQIENGVDSKIVGDWDAALYQEGSESVDLSSNAFLENCLHIDSDGTVLADTSLFGVEISGTLEKNNGVYELYVYEIGETFKFKYTGSQLLLYFDGQQDSGWEPFKLYFDKH